MNITLFGAAFDPPHLGHQKIAVSLLEKGLTDAVWFLPVKEHAFGKKLAAGSQRLAMVELLAQSVLGELKESDAVTDHSQKSGSELIRVETYEFSQPGTSYTYLTLTDLAQRHPQYRLSFVIGSDNLARFHEWSHYLDMLLKFPFYVYPRDGFPLTPLYPGMVVMEDVQPIAVSSTQVREKIKAGESVTGLIPRQIDEYINNQRLYVG